MARMTRIDGRLWIFDFRFLVLDSGRFGRRNRGGQPGRGAGESDAPRPDQAPRRTLFLARWPGMGGGILWAEDFDWAFDFLIASNRAPDAFGVAVGQGSEAAALDPDLGAGRRRRGRDVGCGVASTGSASAFSAHRQTLGCGERLRLVHTRSH